MKCENCIYFNEEWEKIFVPRCNGLEEEDVIADYCYALPRKVNIDKREQRVCLIYKGSLK